jgi:hypothetical protein
MSSASSAVAGVILIFISCRAVVSEFDPISKPPILPTVPLIVQVFDWSKSFDSLVEESALEVRRIGRASNFTPRARSHCVAFRQVEHLA